VDPEMHKICISCTVSMTVEGFRNRKEIVKEEIVEIRSENISSESLSGSIKISF
jgi:hypothetical protein